MMLLMPWRLSVQRVCHRVVSARQRCGRSFSANTRQGFNKTKDCLNKNQSGSYSQTRDAPALKSVLSPYLKISEEVQAALANNKPVVALESTIYTHGLPYPDNVELARHLEQILRDSGVTPATIGIIGGVPTVGMSSEQLQTLSSAFGDSNTMKVSRRDLPYIIGLGLSGSKRHGGTTVAGTMILAGLAGIKVFATGGIGGVHRGGEDTLDISADLNELGRTSVTVIASGCKSFLDIPRTLEYLETQGATVATFDDTQGKLSTVPFPAFYTRDSGVRSPLVVRTPEEAAAITYSRELLGSSFSAGFLLANPIPEEFAIPTQSIDAAIQAAVAEAAQQGITGHANTPFILARIKDLTAGKSVEANKALIESNVKLAARVASHLQRLRSNNHETSFTISSAPPPPSFPSPVPPLKTFDIAQTPQSNVDVMVFGSLAIDLSCDFSPDQHSSQTAVSPTLHTSNISTITTTLGGVGHNVALATSRASARKLNVRLCSFVADDLAGKLAISALTDEGLALEGVRVKPITQTFANGDKRRNHTAQYVAFNDTKKDLVMAMADMSIFNKQPYHIRTGQSDLKEISAATWTVIDANFDSDTIQNIARGARNRGSKIIFEPVSTQKSIRVFNSRSDNSSISATFPRNLVDLASPNKYEVAAMHSFAREKGLMDKPGWWDVIDAMGIPSTGARDRFREITNAEMTDEGIPVQSIQLLPFIPTILTKLGPAGVLHTELLKPNDTRLTEPESAPFILSRCTNGTDRVGGVYMRLYPAAEIVDNVVSVNGVGDTFLGVLTAGLASGMRLDEHLIDAAQRGAVKTLRSSKSVASDLMGILSGDVEDAKLAETTEELLEDAEF